MTGGGPIECQARRSAWQRGVVFIDCLPVIPSLQQCLTFRGNFEDICQFLDELAQLV